MALYHLSTKPVSRSAGRSAPASAAYRSGEKVLEHGTGETWDYTRKQGVEHTEIVLPTAAAKQDIQWARDREQLWNAAEAAEHRKDSRVAREWEVALPHELNKTQRVELAREFAGEIANRYGCAVDVALHQPHRTGNNKNFHAHLLTTTRTIEPDGLGRKTDIELGDRDRAKKGLESGGDEIVLVRERWKTLMNERLQELGHPARVDHRSLKAQGIDRQPTVHLGPSVTAMERRGISTEVGNRVREEQRAEQQLRLEKAKELGALERESAVVEKSILDLSGDLKAALTQRDQRQGIDLGLEKSGPAKRDPFVGLELGAGQGGPKADPFAGLKLDRAATPSIDSGSAAMKDLNLDLALDRYARAWNEVETMPERGLPVLEHQTAALKKAGEELDRIRPEATTDLSRAVAFEPSARHSMQTLEGPERSQKLVVALANEERLRNNPEARGERTVKVWKGLEQRHEKLAGAEHKEARHGVEQQLRHLAREIKQDGPLGRTLQERSRSLGIEMGSPLDEVLKARTLERAQELSLPARSRGLERGLGL